ncbi:C3a anaphylatoxin chemotactic receptor-like [Hemitrygon akajei]|uniref:C3a anaphylatoxin chemotactic receptor-like n=1 Tax=Hemitrygon akajei TaxID=2704970 RepID=UPI003BF9907F
MMYYGDDYFYNMSSFGNYSDESIPEDSGTQLPTSAILSIFVYALTFMLCVPGNGAVIWVTGFKMKRSVNTVWFLNLAVADLTYCLSLPFQMANVALGNSWPTDNVLCKLIPSAIVLNMYASVFLLTLISIDRFLSVTRPVSSQTHRSLSWVRAACLAAWGLAFLMSLPTLLTRKMYIGSEFNLTYCTLNYTGTYFGDRTREVVEKLQRGKFAKSSKARKPVRLIAVVVAAFFLCWLPYHICGLAQAFSKHQADWVWDSLSVGLASLNSALNPILYVFAGHDFRQVFRRSLCNSLRLAFAEERTESACKTRMKTISTSDGTRSTLRMHPDQRPILPSLLYRGCGQPFRSFLHSSSSGLVAVVAAVWDLSPTLPSCPGGRSEPEIPGRLNFIERESRLQGESVGAQEGMPELGTLGAGSG